MKKILLFFTVIFLASCDFSQFFKKEITAIVCVDQIDLLPNEELAFDLSVLPEKMTVPEWKIEYDDSVIQFNVVEIPDVTPRYERTIKALKTGRHSLKITETTSRLSKTVIINCAETIDDFTLPPSKILSINTSFRIADYATFIPAENIIYDFDYEFDTALLSYNADTDFFKTASVPGETEITVKEAKTGITRIIKIVITDQDLAFDPFSVNMLVSTPLPAEIVEAIIKNNLQIVYPENDGLRIDKEQYSVTATAAKTWTIEFYMTSGEEQTLFAYMDIIGLPLENPVFEIEVPLISETPLSEEIRAFIEDNDLSLVYDQDGGLFIDPDKYTVLVTVAKTHIIELYKTFDGQTFLFGRLQISSEPIQTTPFEKITLEAGLKKSMPEDLVQFIKEHNLEADYELNTGLSIELKDYSLTASDAGEWIVELFKTVQDKKFTLATVPVVCAEWFFVDFYYAQRVLEKRQYTLVNEDALLDRFHEMKNISLSYSWSGNPMRPLTYDEHKSMRDRATWFKDAAGGDRIFINYTAECNDKQTYKKSSLWIENETVSYSTKDKINFTDFSNSSKWKPNFYYYKYDTSAQNNSLPAQQTDAKSYVFVTGCHYGQGEFTGITGSSTHYNHAFYKYPKETIYEYDLAFELLDSYFSSQIEKVKENFENTATSEIFSIDGLSVATTDGSFSIKENQDDKIYDNVGSGGSIETENVPIEQLDNDKKSGHFTKIAFDAANIMIEKTLSMVKEPKYPIIRKIVLSWTSDQMVFKGFTQVVNDDYHTISISDNQNNQTLTINITEKDLKNDNAILYGVIGHALFEDANGHQIQKLIEVIKEN